MVHVLQATLPAVAVLVLSGCSATIPPEALELHPDTVERRSLESRRFDTTDEGKLITACAGFLQDQGYALESSEVALGVLVGSKERDATNTGAVILGVLFTGSWEKRELIRASVVTRPSTQVSTGTVVRITFQRIVWNNNGRVVKLEAITDPEIYLSVFRALSEAVFLEAHQI